MHGRLFQVGIDSHQRVALNFGERPFSFDLTSIIGAEWGAPTHEPLPVAFRHARSFRYIAPTSTAAQTHGLAADTADEEEDVLAADTDLSGEDDDDDDEEDDDDDDEDEDEEDEDEEDEDEDEFDVGGEGAAADGSMGGGASAVAAVYNY